MQIRPVTYHDLILGRESAMNSGDTLRPAKTEDNTLREGARLEIVATMRKHVECLKKQAAISLGIM